MTGNDGEPWNQRDGISLARASSSVFLSSGMFVGEALSPCLVARLLRTADGWLAMSRQGDACIFLSVLGGLCGGQPC